MKLLVTGRQGQVARSLAERAPARGIRIVLAGRPDLDLAKPETLRPIIEQHAPDVIVSAAAYTGVDKAESEPELAYVVNAEAPGHLARVAAESGVPIVHLSTDYVFDGSGERPWRETDPVAPLGIYGASKLAGERAISEATSDCAILRTAWVYSPFGNNFVKTMLRLAETREELGVVADQIGNPTSALDLAEAILTVASNLRIDASPDRRGIFHMAGAGTTSWAGLAEYVFDCARDVGLPAASVREIGTADFPTPAKRPANSRLDCGRLAQHHGVTLPQWKESVREVVARLATDRVALA